MIAQPIVTALTPVAAYAEDLSEFLDKNGKLDLKKLLKLLGKITR